MGKSSGEVSVYYDDHALRVQRRTGLNMRQRAIYRFLKAEGLSREASILEVGCGIGLLSGKLADTVNRGKLLGVDISAVAIELAKESNKRRKNARFMVSDMDEFEVSERFDLIVLPDVLEHIPEEQHERIFRSLVHHLNEGGKVCINIPDAGATEYYQVNDPQKLQIIDQPLRIFPMMERFNAVGLLLDKYFRYSLWLHEVEYNWIVFEKRRDHTGMRKRGKMVGVLREYMSRMGVLRYIRL